MGLVALAILFASLGMWQVRRASETRALGARFTGAAQAQALERAPDALSEDLRFRRLGARGFYVPEPQFLLDNRVRDGIAGYEVLTLFRLADDHRFLIVNRGWVRANPDRRVLPDIEVGGEPREVEGRLERLPRPGLRLGDDTAAPSPKRAVEVVLYPTAREISTKVGEPVLDYELLLDDAATDGYARGWSAPGLPIERHVAYAGQWFFLALGALGAGATIAVRAVRPPRPASET